jgi:hypothetical protein
MRGILQDIVNRNYESYRRQHRLPVRELKALHSLRTCRTSAQGVHIRLCPNGDYREHFYNSCKHRSCPQCGGWEGQRWVQQWEQRLLPCPYYHIVLTLPDELNVLWRYNRGAFQNGLFQAAWHIIHKLFSDPQWVGGCPGALAVFQSWGETLNLHPHLHILVTAGGLSPDGRWVAARQSYLFPGKLLTDQFRDTLLRKLGQALFQKRRMRIPQGQSQHHWLRIFHALAEKDWHAHIQPPYGHPMGVIRYLAFYMHGGPISEDRIDYAPDGSLRVAYKRPDEHRSRFATFTELEFLNRLLLHVPEKGQRLVRAYGLFHHRSKAKAEHARRAMKDASVNEERPRPGERCDSSRLASPRSPGLRCPHCGARLLVHRLDHWGRDPPREVAA